MTTCVLISFYSDDRPGVIEEISAVVDRCGGNWLDSQLSRLGGRFAGVLRVHLPRKSVEALGEGLAELERNGISASCTEAGDPVEHGATVYRLSLMGPDRRGIVHELTRRLHAAGFNVQSMTTWLESAPMSGETMFQAAAEIEVADPDRLEALRGELEALSDAMTLEIDIEPGT